MSAAGMRTAEARKSRCIGIQQISESIGGNYHCIMPALNVDRLPARRLNPIAARFQRLIDRIGTDDVGRRQAIANLISQLEWRYEGIKRMRREAILYELCLRRVRDTKGGGRRRRNAQASASFLCRLGACLYDILR